MSMKFKVTVAALAILSTGCSPPPTSSTTPSSSPISTAQEKRVILTIDSSRWPNISQHVSSAQLSGKPTLCTIDRPGASRRREQALHNVPTSPGYDRDEYPPAVCREGGAGADVVLVPSSENRSEGAWMGQEINNYPDGTTLEITVSK